MAVAGGHAWGAHSAYTCRCVPTISSAPCTFVVDKKDGFLFLWCSIRKPIPLTHSLITAQMMQNLERE